MGMRLRRRDPVVLGTPAAPAARGTRGSSIVRTLRTAWWPRFAVAGVVLTVIGATLLSGAARALVALGGAVVFVFAVTQGLQRKSWDQDRRREPPMPPGGGSVSQNF
jgi:hypothetical protein